MPPEQQRVLESLRNGSATSAELAEEAGVPPDDLTEALMSLVRENYVWMVQAYWPESGGPTPHGWLYSLSRKGIRVVAS